MPLPAVLSIRISPTRREGSGLVEVRSTIFSLSVQYLVFHILSTRGIFIIEPTWTHLLSSPCLRFFCNHLLHALLYPFWKLVQLIKCYQASWAEAFAPSGTLSRTDTIILPLLGGWLITCSMAICTSDIFTSSQSLIGLLKSQVVGCSPLGERM